MSQSSGFCGKETETGRTKKRESPKSDVSDIVIGFQSVENMGEYLLAKLFKLSTSASD